MCNVCNVRNVCNVYNEYILQQRQSEQRTWCVAAVLCARAVAYATQFVTCNLRVTDLVRDGLVLREGEGQPVVTHRKVELDQAVRAVRIHALRSDGLKVSASVSV